MMKRFALMLAVVVAASPALAAEMAFSGTAKIKPTLYSNFDFRSELSDAPALNEGGWASGEHVRAELRLGWNAKGDKWTVMMIGEVDMILEKDTADRTFYGPSTKGFNTNAGAEFGIERAEFTYEFSPMLKLASGINLRSMDIATGGMVFGDDHPFIEASGTVLPQLKYQLGYLMIQNRPSAPDGSTTPATVTRTGSLRDDWRAYYLRLPISIDAAPAKLLLTPFVLKSDNEAKYARAMYYGAELTGQIAMVKPYAEFAMVTGDFDLNRRGSGTAPVATDISSMAYFLGLEVPLNKAFSPYVAYRHTDGDGDAADADAEGFVGVTDIGRFTGLLGMDGNVLSEHLASGASVYNSPLYSYSPDRAGGGNVYGGIGNGSSGNNPGQNLIAVGARGDLGDFVPNLSYKAQLFYIQYDDTSNLAPGAGQTVTEVDKNVGTEVDVQLKYAFSANFAVDLIASVLMPGDGIKEQLPATASDTMAQAWTLTFAWTY